MKNTIVIFLKNFQKHKTFFKWTRDRIIFFEPVYCDRTAIVFIIFDVDDDDREARIKYLVILSAKTSN